MNNMMWQTHMKQMDQLNGSLKPPQRQTFGGGKSTSGDSRHHDNTPYRHHASQNNSTGRSQRYAEEPGSGRHQQHGHGRESHHHHHQHQSNRSGNRHYDNRGGNRPYDDRGSNRGYQDSRWQRYWDVKKKKIILYRLKFFRFEDTFLKMMNYVEKHYCVYSGCL